MKYLKFIGRGSAFNAKEGNTSAFVKSGSNLFLLDCGESVFHSLLLKGVLEDVKNIYVAITHFHPDHVGSLGSLIFYTNHKLKGDIYVLYPKKEKLDELFKAIGVGNEDYIYCHPENFNGVKELQIKSIEAIRTTHTKSLDSYAYTIIFEEFYKVFYTGDTNTLSISMKELKEEYKELYIDTCSYDFEDNPHFSVKRLCELIPEALRSKVYCMHIDSEETEKMAEKNGFNVVKRI